jgi:hypothetical protein
MNRRQCLVAFASGSFVVIPGCSATDDPSKIQNRTGTSTTGTLIKSTKTSQETHHTETKSGLQTARKQVARAESLFQRWGGTGNDTLLGVDLASNPSSVETIKNLLRSARENYTIYSQNNENTGRIQTELNRVRTLLDWVIIQKRLIKAHRTISEQSTTHLYNQNYQKLSDSIDEFEDVSKKAKTRLETHLEWKENTNMPISSIDPSIYEAKILQFKINVDGLSFVKTSLLEQESLIRGLVMVIRSYLQNDFEKGRAGELINAARTNKETLETYCCSTTLVQNLIRKYESAMSAVIRGLEMLIQAQKSDTDTSEVEEKAKSAFRSSALVEESDGELNGLISRL